MASRFIYDIYKDGEYIGDYQVNEIAEKFGINKDIIPAAVQEERLVKKHYKIKRVDRAVSKKSPLLIEFEMIAKSILQKAGRA